MRNYSHRPVARHNAPMQPGALRKSLLEQGVRVVPSRLRSTSAPERVAEAYRFLSAAYGIPGNVDAIASAPETARQMFDQSISDAPEARQRIRAYLRIIHAFVRSIQKERTARKRTADVQEKQEEFTGFAEPSEEGDEADDTRREYEARILRGNPRARRNASDYENAINATNRLLIPWEADLTRLVLPPGYITRTTFENLLSGSSSGKSYEKALQELTSAKRQYVPPTSTYARRRPGEVYFDLLASVAISALRRVYPQWGRRTEAQKQELASDVVLHFLDPNRLMVVPARSGIFIPSLVQRLNAERQMFFRNGVLNASALLSAICNSNPNNRSIVDAPVESDDLTQGMRDVRMMIELFAREMATAGRQIVDSPVGEDVETIASASAAEELYALSPETLAEQREQEQRDTLAADALKRLLQVYRTGNDAQKRAAEIRYVTLLAHTGRGNEIELRVSDALKKGRFASREADHREEHVRQDYRLSCAFEDLFGLRYGVSRKAGSPVQLTHGVQGCNTGSPHFGQIKRFHFDDFQPGRAVTIPTRQGRARGVIVRKITGQPRYEVMLPNQPYANTFSEEYLETDNECPTCGQIARLLNVEPRMVYAAIEKDLPALLRGQAVDNPRRRR